SAMEAMAGGCVPVCSAVGALGETVGPGGLLVRGMPDNASWQDFYLECLYAALVSPDIRKPLEYAGRRRAQELTWDKAMGRWKGIVATLLNRETSANGRPADPLWDAEHPLAVEVPVST